MDFDEAKKALTDGYRALGMELVDEQAKELFFRIRHPRIKVDMSLSQDEIAQYAEAMSVAPEYSRKPVECSICSKDYREHALRPSQYDRRARLRTRTAAIVFGVPDDDTLRAEIGPASPLYSNLLRFHEGCVEQLLSRVRWRSPRPSEGPWEAKNLLYAPLTIKVHHVEAGTTAAALRRSSTIIDACLFELSYLQDMTLILDEELPGPRPRQFRFQQPAQGVTLPLPSARFSPDVVRFYQRGMSTTDPVHQFLSYYHVLEYFFHTVSDEQLHVRLASTLKDPRFSVAPSGLDRLIRHTLEHKRETDETTMLKLVLDKYVDSDEVITFIKAYEEHLGTKMYSKRGSIFGESLEIKLEAGHVLANIATRIKTVRNALVHSSGQYDPEHRYVPTVKAEARIRLEVPLLKHLAERVIIASAG